MRGFPATIEISIIFFILGILLIFMCLPIGTEPISAKNGVYEIQSKDVGGRIYSLRGEWLFYYGKLLVPEDFNGDTTTINIPNDWESAGFSLSGCATYHLIINIDNSEALMLYIPEISSAYALWVNGRPVRKAGIVSDNEETGRPYYENALIPIAAVDGVIELTVQVSNYHYFLGGITNPMLLGDSDAILSWFLRTRALYCIALGCVLMAAFYHMALFIFQRREKAYLILSILCGLCFFRFLLETDGINQFLKWIPMGVVGIRLYIVLYFLHCVLVFLFAIYIFRRDFLLMHQRIVWTYVVLGTLIYALMPLNTPITLLVFTLTTLPLGLFIVFFASRSPVLRSNRWSWLYFSSLLIYVFVGSAAKLVFENVLFMSGLLNNIFMIMTQSLVLSWNYAEAFETVKHTNENLERIVDDRTMDLQNTNKAMKELVGNISHDLKTPLTAMSMNLERLLEMTPTSGSYSQYIQIAYNKSLDLKRLIQNLIEVSRIETGQSLYNPRWHSLNKLLSHIQDKYGDYLESEGLYLEISSGLNAASEADTLIYTDPIKIWSVFDNIIYNAVRYTQDGGITIAAEQRGDKVILTIADTGCGIAPEHLPHIFERFYKVSSDRGVRDGDSGVGLYIVKSVMESCKGGVRNRFQQISKIRNNFS